MVLFTFAYPQYLLLFLMIPIIFFIHFFSLGNKKKKALKFANFDAIAKIEGIDFFSKNVISLVLNIVIVSLLIFSLSGLTLHKTAKATDFSFVISIDSSKSMEATDLSPNRISAAKVAATKFVDFAPLNTRFGVVSFAGSSKIEKDVTDSKSEVKDAINGIKLTEFGGTDLYEAVLTGSNLLKNEDHKAIILLSDGQLNVGTVDDAISYANENDVIVHAIGMGTIEGGSTEFGFSKLDEDSLKSISYNTNGAYFNTTNEADMINAFEHIFDYTQKNVSIKLADYLLLIGIILLLVEFFLSNTRYTSFP